MNGNLSPHFLEHRNDRFQGSGFSGTGAAGEDQHTLFDRLPDRLALPYLAIFLRRSPFGGVDVFGLDMPVFQRREIRHQTDARGNKFFRLIQMRQKQELPAADIRGLQIKRFPAISSAVCRTGSSSTPSIARGRGDQLVRRQTGVAVAEIMPAAHRQSRPQSGGGSSASGRSISD